MIRHKNASGVVTSAILNDSGSAQYLPNLGNWLLLQRYKAMVVLVSQLTV